MVNLNLFVLQKWGRAGILQTFAVVEKGLSALLEEFRQFLCIFGRRVGGVSANLEFVLLSAQHAGCETVQLAGFSLQLHSVLDPFQLPARFNVIEISYFHLDFSLQSLEDRR